MSVHTECGKDIVWARREDDPDRFIPPLEAAGFAYIIDNDGIAKQVVTFRPHNCDPDDVNDWIDRQNALAAAKARRGEVIPDERDLAYEAVSEQRREEAWEIALTVDCRQCLMEKGTKCISMAQHIRKTGEMVEVRNPHTVRTKDALKLMQHRTDVTPDVPFDETREAPDWADEAPEMSPGGFMEVVPLEPVEHDYEKSKQKMCGARELLKSHGGGNDYGAPCTLTVGWRGKHKGQHLNQNGEQWS